MTSFANRANRKPLTSPDDPRHGTRSGYTYWACRCEKCRAANTEVNARWVAANSQKPVPDHVHGSVNGYTNYTCRCDACREASREYERSRRRDLVKQVVICDLGYEHRV